MIRWRNWKDAEELIIKSFVRYFSAINKNGLKILRLFKHVGSNPTLITVCVAEWFMHWIVVPDYVGSNPIVHLSIIETSQVQSLD